MRVSWTCTPLALAASTALCAALLGAPAIGQLGGKPTAAVGRAPVAGEVGGPGLAIRAKKALAVPDEGPQVIDNAVILVREGLIEAIGPARTTAIPAGYEVLDCSDKWVCPGFIDLHSHVGGTFDINEMVYLVNPGLRVSASVMPDNPAFQKAVAGGVTTVLYIPGSGVNVGGQGVLIKTGLGRFEDALVRNPGSMKLAQAGNPEGWTVGVGRSFMNWNTRWMFRRGLLYAKLYDEAEKNGTPKPRYEFDLEIFRWLASKKTQISTHTQIYQVVLTTLTMVRKELGLDVYIDHGEMAGHKLAAFAKDIGVNAILGPRAVEIPTRGFVNFTGYQPEAILGIAAEYQKRGMKRIGFNTDSPVIPQEELFLQASMGARYGLDDSNLETIRGLTIVPAITAGIADKVGSLEPGKEADILILTGDPVDPRTAIDEVLIEGHRVYDTGTMKRRF
ncbi:MAG: amidohydrolase family protein [Planctomycetota bacterium]|nr:amidohydrolase family protein [Planctomycetota bacterium]